MNRKEKIPERYMEELIVPPLPLPKEEEKDEESSDVPNNDVAKEFIVNFDINEES